MKRSITAVAVLMAMASFSPVQYAPQPFDYSRELPGSAGRKSRFTGIAAARRQARKQRNRRAAA